MIIWFVWAYIVWKNFYTLDKLTILEEPDIDTQEYIYSFQKLNGTSEDVLDKALGEFYDHMRAFSIENGIYEFSRNAIISFER